MMQYTFTTDKSQFANINTPTFNNTSFTTSWYPTNIEFNKPYYRIIDNKLTAFKVLAIAVSRFEEPFNTFNNTKITRQKLVYLVQYANSFHPVWEKEVIQSSSIIFNSKEHYLDYVANGCKPCNFNFRQIGEILDDLNIEGYKHYRSSARDVYYFKKTYRWCYNTNKPVECDTFINYMLFTGDGLFISIDHNNNVSGNCDAGFASKEECIAEFIDGMEVVEFGETTINLNVEVKVIKPVSSVIRIINE